MKAVVKTETLKNQKLKYIEIDGKKYSITDKTPFKFDMYKKQYVVINIDGKPTTVYLILKTKLKKSDFTKKTIRYI